MNKHDWDQSVQSLDKLPPHLRDGLRLYVEQGIEPGSFLCACIENKLCEAVHRGSPESLAALKQIAFWLYNEAPSSCWGSPTKRRAWRGFK